MLGPAFNANASSPEVFNAADSMEIREELIDHPFIDNDPKVAFFDLMAF
jgi:hypothetical protein